MSDEREPLRRADPDVPDASSGRSSVMLSRSVYGVTYYRVSVDAGATDGELRDMVDRALAVEREIVGSPDPVTERKRTWERTS